MKNSILNIVVIGCSLLLLLQESYANRFFPNPSRHLERHLEEVRRLQEEAQSEATSDHGLASYQQLAERSLAEKRCTGESETNAFCDDELRFAREKGLISIRAYKWGKQHRWYPEINRHGKVVAVCKCGCFAEGTRILAAHPSGEFFDLPVEELSKGVSVVALSENSSLSNLLFEDKKIQAFVKGPETKKLYRFILSDGKSLSVTEGHGMLKSDGTMSMAKNIQTGDHFIDISGNELRVEKIERVESSPLVYNLEVDSDSKTGHIIVGNEILVGDLAWQNQLVHELERVAVRK